MHFHKKTGDTITLQTPTGLTDFRIVGVLTDFASNEGVIHIDRKLYKKFFKDELVDGFGVYIQDGFTAEAVRKEIDAQLGKDKNLMVLLNRDLKDQIKNNIDESFAYTKAIELAALLVGMLGLLNTFLISVMERTRELGVLRAVGMTRQQLIVMVLSEAVIQGAAGALIAVVIGAALAYIWISTSLSFVLGWVIDFTFPWPSVLKTFAIGVAVAAFAGLWPALRASRLEVREALEYE